MHENKETIENFQREQLFVPVINTYKTDEGGTENCLENEVIKNIKTKYTESVKGFGRVKGFKCS